jgi:hypothetical protein
VTLPPINAVCGHTPALLPAILRSSKKSQTNHGWSWHDWHDCWYGYDGPRQACSSTHHAPSGMRSTKDSRDRIPRRGGGGLPWMMEAGPSRHGMAWHEKSEDAQRNGKCCKEARRSIPQTINHITLRSSFHFLKSTRSSVHLHPPAHTPTQTYSPDTAHASALTYGGCTKLTQHTQLQQKHKRKPFLLGLTTSTSLRSLHYSWSRSCTPNSTTRELVSASTYRSVNLKHTPPYTPQTARLGVRAPSKRVYLDPAGALHILLYPCNQPITSRRSPFNYNKGSTFPRTWLRYNFVPALVIVTNEYLQKGNKHRTLEKSNSSCFKKIDGHTQRCH